jgi:predicted alpha/beta hydrolase
MPRNREPSALGLTIPALDGFPLAARVWQPSEPSRPERVTIVNAGAGIGKEYYDRFAAFLAQHDVATVIYDYRGIGKSRPRSLRGFVASVESWGRLDFSGVLGWVTDRFPSAQRVVIGHSVGGFVTGFTQRGELIDRMLLVGAHTGYWRDYAVPSRPFMYLLWHVAMPVVVRVMGYFHGRLLHLGDDLPAGVALEWAARRRPEFWWNLKDPHGAPDSQLRDELLSRFQRIRAPGLAIRSTDDRFATKAATERIIGLFSNCPIESTEVCPADIGVERIGHFGFFRSRMHATLWRRALNWVEQDVSCGQTREARYA